MNLLPKSIQEAIEALSDLPGIGTRSAERLVFSLLKNKTGLEQKIARSLEALKSNIQECEQCHHFCDKPSIISDEKVLCEICKTPNRNQKVICVLETPIDLTAIERTHEFKGLFHVLHGVISPLQKVTPEDLRIQSLFDRLEANPEIDEIILALSGNMESEATALYLMENLPKHFQGKISRLARGIPMGGDLDYLDAGTLGRAILDRN